jgi:hypothetical protein
MSIGDGHHTAPVDGRATLLGSGFIGEASMSAALHQTLTFLQYWAHRFHEARQAKAQQIVDQHRRFYRPETLQ